MLKEQLIFNLLYKWKYLIAFLKAKSIKKKTSEKISSITYVAREADKDWIFGAKVKRLAKFSKLQSTTYFHNGLRSLPDSDGYFFIFHQYFYRAMRHNPKILNKRNIVMFTHENYTTSFSKTHVIWCLNKADKVVCLNSKVQEKLIKAGLQKEKTALIHIASNPDFFFSHERKTGTVGFCSAFSDRKNPKLIFDLVKNTPERQFYLIGRYWDKYENFNELMSLQNFTYFDNEAYETYPNLYNKIDIFISPSKIEGGPVPILEAMLSNCFPIASKTGFAEDIITHGENGFLFDTNADYKTVKVLIDKAGTKTIDVRKTALPYSWENSSHKIDALFIENN
jgi:glycosyltransferase involved in cell wall biosynthesis